MNKIGHRATALLLCVVLLFGLSISAGARESQCIDHYNVKASALGNGKISIEVALSGTEPMQEIGAKMKVNSSTAKVAAVYAEYLHQTATISVTPNISYPIGGSISVSSENKFERLTPNPYLMIKL